MITAGYTSADSTFSLSYEDESTDDTVIVSAPFEADGFPETFFSVTFEDGILDLSMFAPEAYSTSGVAKGLLGKNNDMCPGILTLNMPEKN